MDNEHLLVALLEQENGAVARILQGAGGDLAAIRTRATQALARLPQVSGSGRTPGQVYITPRLDETLAAAETEAKHLKDEYVSVEHLLLALADEARGGAAPRLLREAGLTRERLLAAMAEVRGHQRVTSPTPEATYEALSQIRAGPVGAGRAGEPDPVIGRDAEIRRVIRILSRRTKNNPVLIG